MDLSFSLYLLLFSSNFKEKYQEIPALVKVPAFSCVILLRRGPTGNAKREVAPRFADQIVEVSRRTDAEDEQHKKGGSVDPPTYAAFSIPEPPAQVYRCASLYSCLFLLRAERSYVVAARARLVQPLPLLLLHEPPCPWLPLRL